jgi:FKBP-type peptidyl-prolyl cis-trans isomerase
MRNIFMISLMALLLMSFGCSKKSKVIKITKDSKEIEKIAYALGVQYGKSLTTLELDKKVQKFVALGLVDYQNGKVTISNNDIQYLAKKADGILAIKRSESAKSEKIKGTAFVENLIKEDTTYQQTDSGLVFKVIKSGKIVIKLSDAPFVTMHFESYHLDGKQFESTKDGNARLMPLKGVFSAWTEAFSIVGEGGEIEIISPPSLTYGDNGAKPYIEPGEYLKFKLTFDKYYSNKP